MKRMTFITARQFRHTICAVAWSSILMLCGCHPQETAPLPIIQHGDQTPVAIWYGVGSCLSGQEEQGRTILSRDFAQLRSLGFNTVLTDELEDGRRTEILDVAQEQSLRVILPHNRTTAYIRGGRFDPDVIDEAEVVVQKNIQEVSRHPAMFMHFICDAPEAEATERVAEIAGLYRRFDDDHPALAVLSRDAARIAQQSDLPIVLWDNFPLAEDSPPGELRNRREEHPPTHNQALTALYAQTPKRSHWAMIQAVAIPERLRFPSPAEWDLLYHSALAAGFTDGVMFYTYLAGNPAESGLVKEDRTLSPERSVALTRLIQRILKWGPLVRGTAPLSGVVRAENDRVSTMLLVRTKRRLLLAYNPNVETFSHDTIRVPTTVQGQPVARVVDVIEPQRFLPNTTTNEIPIQVNLKPGEGRLYELFAP